MNSKKLYSSLLLLAGEILIIISFLHFGRNSDSNFILLDIIVTTIIYCLLTHNILFSTNNFKDESHKNIGSHGINWFFSFFYIIVVILAMVYFQMFKPISIYSQIILHGILFFLLMVGFFLSFLSSQKVYEIFKVENKKRSRIEEMKKATKEVQNKIALTQNVPIEIIPAIALLHENLRFISPCNNQEAFELETSFINEMKSIHDCLFDIPINSDKIVANMQKCERTFKERKQIFSK